MADRPVFSTSRLALFPAVYLVHLVDERFYWIGTADFATQYLGIYFTNTAWWWVNVPSLVLLTLATVLLARGTWPQWVAVALAIHLISHGLGRVPTSLWTQTIAPGLLSGLALCTPLAAATLGRAWFRLSRKELMLGFVAGNLSFQPYWHFVLLPWLPSPPSPL